MAKFNFIKPLLHVLGYYNANVSNNSATISSDSPPQLKSPIFNNSFEKPVNYDDISLASQELELTPFSYPIPNSQPTYNYDITPNSTHPISNTPHPISNTPHPISHPISNTPHPISHPISNTPHPISHPISNTPHPISNTPHPISNTPHPISHPISHPIYQPISNTPHPISNTPINNFQDTNDNMYYKYSIKKSNSILHDPSDHLPAVGFFDELILLSIMLNKITDNEFKNNSKPIQVNPIHTPRNINYHPLAELSYDSPHNVKSLSFINKYSPDNKAVSSGKPFITSPNNKYSPDNKAVSSGKPFITSPNNKYSPDNKAVSSVKPFITSPNNKYSPDNKAVSSVKPFITSPNNKYASSRKQKLKNVCQKKINTPRDEVNILLGLNNDTDDNIDTSDDIDTLDDDNIDDYNIDDDNIDDDNIDDNNIDDDNIVIDTLDDNSAYNRNKIDELLSIN